MSEYLDRLIESLEREAERGRADMRRQLTTNRPTRHLAGQVNRIAQRLETLKRLQIAEAKSSASHAATVRALRQQARSSRRVSG